MGRTRAPSSDCLDELARRLLAELCESRPLGYVPRIEWRAYRVTAGTANHRGGWIGLSSVLLDTVERVESTLKHEYAHLLAVARHGPRAAGHGPAWQRAMADLGLEPEVHHRYPVSRNVSRLEVAYRCLNCGATLTRRRRLPRNRRYVHAGCGGSLKFAGARTATPSPLES